jgi:hypothetical protein
MMRIPRPLFLRILPLALVAATLAATSASAQTNYPLVCRGGGGLRLIPKVALQPPGAIMAQMQFNRATHAAVTGVEPGTCAWQDRGINNAEPNALCFTGVRHLSFDLGAGRELAWMRAEVWGGDASVIFWEGGEQPDGAAFQLGNSAEYQHYRAHNDPVHGCLEVTHVGP